MSRKTAREIVKVNRLVNTISIILMMIVSIGGVLILGFVDNLNIFGLVIGLAVAFLPLIWFRWLDKIEWESERTQQLIIKAKHELYREKLYKSLERKPKYGRF